MKICQSCGMPMDPSLYGKNEDGSANQMYCTYCYPEGAFKKPHETFEEMVETCIPFMMEEGYSEEQARSHLKLELKKLKRWQ